MFLPMNQQSFQCQSLKSSTSYEYAVKSSFAFAEEIVEQDCEFFMGSLDADSLFTNIQPEETIDIRANAHFEITEKAEGLSKTEFKEHLSSFKFI